MEDDILTLLDDDDAEIPVVGGGAKRTLKGDTFSEAKPTATPASATPATPAAPAAPSSSAPAPAAPKPSKASFDLAAQLEQDKKDIEAAKKKLETHTDARSTKEVHGRIDLMLDNAIKESGVALQDPDLANRYHAISKTYFRGLRDSLETKSKLTMPVASGGLGMSDDDAGKVMALFKTKLASFQDAMLERQKGDKERFVAKEAGKHLDEGTAGEVKEQRDLDRKFQEITGKDRLEGARPAPMPVGTPVRIPVTEDAPPKPPQPSMADVVVSGAKRTPPAAPVAVPHPAVPEPQEMKLPEELGPDAHELDQPKLAPPPQDLPFADAPAPTPPPAAVTKPLVAPSAPTAPSSPSMAPAPSVPSMSPAPAPVPTPPAMRPAPPAPAMPGTRPVVADVKPAGMRLTGPIQELQSFGLVDFRRLSKDPKERTLKIKDKIDLLEDQSFGTKVEGIKAWQSSPVNRMYLEMLRTSLDGKPLPEVITELEAAGEDVLSKEEFDVIMELNRSLRFG